MEVCFLDIDCENVINSGKDKVGLFKVKTVCNPQLERLPSRIQSGKPHCPKCDVPVTDIGTCPYCHASIKKRWKPAKLKDFFEIFTLGSIKQGEKIIPRGVIVDVLYRDKSFFKGFKMSEYSFSGEISNYKSYPRLLTCLDDKLVALRNRKRIPLVHVEKVLECEECGCKVSVQDLDRGEIVCPRCGLVQGQVEMFEGDVVL